MIPIHLDIVCMPAAACLCYTIHLDKHAKNNSEKGWKKKKKPPPPPVIIGEWDFYVTRFLARILRDTEDIVEVLA